MAASKDIVLTDVSSCQLVFVFSRHLCFNMLPPRHPQMDGDQWATTQYVRDFP